MQGRQLLFLKVHIGFIHSNADSCSDFLMHEQGSQHLLCSFYCTPSSSEKREKKEEDRKEETEKRGEKRGRKGEKTDGDRWAKRQVRKDRWEEGAERRRRRDRGIDWARRRRRILGDPADISGWVYEMWWLAKSC